MLLLTSLAFSRAGKERHWPPSAATAHLVPGRAWGHHVANELGVPLLLKRVLDLLNMYVGETEQRIAAMFEQTQDEGAVLVLDEADSFLRDEGVRNLV